MQVISHVNSSLTTDSIVSYSKIVVKRFYMAAALPACLLRLRCPPRRVACHAGRSCVALALASPPLERLSIAAASLRRWRLWAVTTPWRFALPLVQHPGEYVLV